jgi:hypothetical protein
MTKFRIVRLLLALAMVVAVSAPMISNVLAQQTCPDGSHECGRSGGTINCCKDR